MSADQAPSQLEAAEVIPIAQLNPDLSDPKARVVRGVVTITWPYSIINKTVAFLLAEPDFRLRRAKGQVRVEFSGSSAKAVQDAGLRSGDEVTLGLDGVELVADESKTRVPGTSLEWQLKFNERLLLQAKISESEEVKLIDIDHPTAPEPESQPEPEQLPESVLDSFEEPAKSPEQLATPVRNLSAKRPAHQTFGLDEYASPAFLKRARMSYGSLFEESLDIFNDDIPSKTPAKKRAKTGRYSGVWRYASQSPSPEPHQNEDDDADAASMAGEKLHISTPSRPQMVDGGCQTMELDASPPRNVQVAAEARHDSSQWQTPTKSAMIDSGVQSDMPTVMDTPNFGMPSGMGGHFGEPAPMPMFRSAHEHYTPAFDQPPVGPEFDHDMHHSDMDPKFHADSFHQHANSYPEAGLEHSVEAHAQYPASFLDTSHLDPHLTVTSQPLSEPVPAHCDHQPPQGPVREPERHTTFVDAIAEPQQVPWGLTSLQPPRSPAKPAGMPSSASEPGARKDEVASAEENEGIQAIPNDKWAEDREQQTEEHHEDSEGEQAAMKIEDDQLLEDDEGPEENFTSKTYAERHFEPVEKQEATATSKEAQSSSEGSDSSEDSDDEAEHEEDDNGGDYDITNYRNLSNNQDDDDGSDLESDYGQEDEEDMFEADGHGDEDDDVDEDPENYREYDEYEEEEDYDEDEDQENQPPPATVPKGAPQVISLLSDSEDEDEDVPDPVPVVPARQMPQDDGSADEMDRYEDEEEDMDEESDKENIRHEKVPRHSSPVVSDEESEEDEGSGSESDGGTPTPKPREAAGNPGSARSVDDSSPGATHNSENITSGGLAEDLETMSPVRLPHSTELPKEAGSRPASRDDCSMLDAELEQELEQEIAADTTRDNRKTTDEPGLPTPQVPEVRTGEEQANVTACEEAMDTTASDDKVETEVRTDEVRKTPPRTSFAEVNLEPTDQGVPEPMDITLADADEKPVDESVFREQLQESTADVAKTPELFLEEKLDEEDLIQSQLADETMAEERTRVIETSAITFQHEILVDEPEQTNQKSSSLSGSPILHVTEEDQVESTIELSAVTVRVDEDDTQREAEDAMDVDEPDAKLQEIASPPPTQNQSQSFEETRLVETHAETHVFQGIGEDDALQLVQLPTPGETQITESFVSKSVAETLQTEQVMADAASPGLDNEVRQDEQPPAPTMKNPENPAEPTSPINEDSSQIRDSSAQPSEAHSSLIAEDASEDINNPQPTPKRGRGHRRNKSDNKDPDPSVKLARASIASRRSTRLSDRTTPDSTRVATRARSHSLALRSDSDDEDGDDDIQLARAAIKSPSRAAKQAKEEPVATVETTTASLKAQLVKKLQTLPDCISLKVLRNHPGKNVDVLAIATTEPPEAKRAKGGPRGIMLAFNVADHSVAPTQAVPVQIFRPHKAALPVVHPGDAILLRHFSILSMTGRGFGLRANDSSSWAVFERDSEDGLPQIRGPPVELTEQETSYAALLKQWYAGLDAKTLAKLDKANETSSSRSGA